MYLPTFFSVESSESGEVFGRAIRHGLTVEMLSRNFLDGTGNHGCILSNRDYKHRPRLCIKPTCCK